MLADTAEQPTLQRVANKTMPMTPKQAFDYLTGLAKTAAWGNKMKVVISVGKDKDGVERCWLQCRDCDEYFTVTNISARCGAAPLQRGAGPWQLRRPRGSFTSSRT